MHTSATFSAPFNQYFSNFSIMELTNLFFNNFFIKNESHDTIYIFKNYFPSTFSVFSEIIYIKLVYQTVLQNYNTLPLSNHNNRPPQDPTNPTDPQVRERGEELLLEKLFFGRSSKSWPEIKWLKSTLTSSPSRATKLAFPNPGTYAPSQSRFWVGK